ncbi:MAG: type VI secretion system tip protein VgrG [Deltaproteobacteria bacterium]|jgi:type VI secretion system secreted protein VgrG|nr:type VI secretion system tip protein VgrG [Deltaproteobacteria bacterium]MBW2537709.1 type VI secretion system tip protein VgrG [Deltaproteobacteria bacterium]
MSSTDHPLALAFHNGESSLQVRRFTIDEGLSRLFSVSVVAVSPKPDIDFEQIVGHAASFRLTVGKRDSPVEPTRVWSGVCNHFELLQPELGTPGATTPALSTYFLRIVPNLWLTTQRRTYRIFQQKPIPQLVQEILDPWGIGGRWELRRESVDPVAATGDETFYRKYDYLVQYGESDFHFICRLLERAGITFYFRFPGTDDAVLVFDDAPQAGDPRSLDPIRCFDTPPLKPPPEFITHLAIGHTVQPGTVTLRDYDLRRAYNYRLLGESETKVDAPEDFYEQYRYEPGFSLVDVKKGGSPATPNADDKGIFARHDDMELRWQAERHLQSLRKHKRFIRYESNCHDLAPGVCFSVDGHPRKEISPSGNNSDPTFLTTQTFLEGTATGEVNWTFGGKALFTDAPYVPDRVTPQPKIYGMQSATVVGPKGEEIHTDELGRVRVRFHWDPNRSFDDSNSCWMRVSHDWAGAGFGAVILPRVGQEVLVAFYEGDPDHPVVVGRVYNELAKVPYQLPQHKTRSTWKSDTSPKKDGFNEIMFEDLENKELVYVQAQRDLQKLVKAYETERTKDERVGIVGKDQTTVVGKLDARMVGKRYLLQMMKPTDPDKLEIQPQETPSFSPTATTVEMKDERIIFTTGQATAAFDGKNIRLEAKGNISIHSKGGDVIIEGKQAFINTLPAPAAPQPDAFEPLTPGTFAAIIPPGPPELEALQQEDFSYILEDSAIPEDLAKKEPVELTPCDIREAVVSANLPTTSTRTFKDDVKDIYSKLTRDPSRGSLGDKPNTRQVTFPGSEDECRKGLKKHISGAHSTTLEVVAEAGGDKVPITIHVRYVGSCARGVHPQIDVLPGSAAEYMRPGIETAPGAIKQGRTIRFKQATAKFDVFYEKDEADWDQTCINLLTPGGGGGALLGWLAGFFRLALEVPHISAVATSCSTEKEMVHRTTHLIRVYREDSYGISVAWPCWYINCEANNNKGQSELEAEYQAKADAAKAAGDEAAYKDYSDRADIVGGASSRGGSLGWDDFNFAKKSRIQTDTEANDLGVDAMRRGTPSTFDTYSDLENGFKRERRPYLPAITLTANGDEFNVTAFVRTLQKDSNSVLNAFKAVLELWDRVPRIVSEIQRCSSLTKMPGVGWIIDFDVKFLEGYLAGTWGHRIAQDPGSSGSCRYSLVEWYMEWALGMTLIDFTISVGWGFEVEGPFISERFWRTRAYEFVAKAAGDFSLKAGVEGKWCITDGDKEIAGTVDSSIDLYVSVVAQVLGHGLELRSGIIGGIDGRVGWKFGPGKPADFSAELKSKEVYFYACWKSSSGVENPDFKRTLMREGRWLHWRHD